MGKLATALIMLALMNLQVAKSTSNPLKSVKCSFCKQERMLAGSSHNTRVGEDCDKYKCPGTWEDTSSPGSARSSSNATATKPETIMLWCNRCSETKFDVAKTDQRTLLHRTHMA